MVDPNRVDGLRTGLSASTIGNTTRAFTGSLEEEGSIYRVDYSELGTRTY